MKKILAMVLALIMVLSLAACGGNNDPAPSGGGTTAPGTSQQTPSNRLDGSTPSGESSNDAEDYLESVISYVQDRQSEAALIYYDDKLLQNSGLLTVWACEPIEGDDTYCNTTWYWGYYNKASSYEKAKTSDTLGFNVDADSVEAVWNDDLTCYSYEQRSSWADEQGKAKDYTIVQERSDTASDKPDDSTPSGSNTPPSTQQSTQNGSEASGDNTVAEFLTYYGWTEDDIKPERFVSFGELEMDGSTPAGESGSMGYITISVDKDATTQEDINAWFEQLSTKMAAQSADGKLYKNFALSAEAPSLQELTEGALWKDYPGVTCFYPCKLDIGEVKLFIAASYKVDEGAYKISIGVK